MALPHTPKLGGANNSCFPDLNVLEDSAPSFQFGFPPTDYSQSCGFSSNGFELQSQPGFGCSDQVLSADPTGPFGFPHPNMGPPSRLAPPHLALPFSDSPSTTRLGTPFSKIPTPTTAISEDSEWGLDDHGTHESKFVQHSLTDSISLSPDVAALDLPFPSHIHRWPFRGASFQACTVPSPPGSPTNQQTSSLHDDVPKSCPVSPQLRPSVVQPPSTSTQPKNPFSQKLSKATQEWARRKRLDGEESDVMDELMGYQGLEEVKQLFLDIKSKADVYKKQDPHTKSSLLRSERFNIVFQGNPGIGKTTVARLYATFLHEIGISGSGYIKETSGIRVATKGAPGIKAKIKKMLQQKDGGVLFVDEAYQLTASYIGGAGREALDIILTMMEKHIGSFVVIFVGYKDEMEPFFEHNPGLASRIPYTINFADFGDAELWKILADNISRKYRGHMRVEGGLDGLYMRIAIRRLAQARGSRGFGNARAVENLLARIVNRQAQRLTRWKQYSTREPDYFLFCKEDMIGPDPSLAAKQCAAWAELQNLVGLDHVKECVGRFVGMIGLNYQRELREESPLKFSLNQVFVGAPGTGKTTVAKLYGQILAQLGYLSRGEVVLKNPADFIGECLGKSEAKTKQILEATVGKVLVIDEAYMLDSGDVNKEQDKFKTGVIDTIVSMVQGALGEDRCIILVGYEDKIRDMFHNVNQGLSRRFPIERPFRFENFTLDQLEQILRFKMREQGLVATDAAIHAARDVFERALMRPNFTKAGEVDSALATAKLNYQTRLSQTSGKLQTSDFSLGAIDFDPEFDRGERTELDCRGMLDGLVHCNIIDRLIGYQQHFLGARRHGLSTREQVPSNFIFKGFPGTGKTITAQHMGKIFYNMGFLSTSEVIECSATDLLGQYVGQTAPKTLKKLQEGLGHVLFIDEAHRLMYDYGSYAAEAVDELVGFLSKPGNVGRMIVILAGLKDDMNRLMYLYPALSGLFPEEITFDHIPPDDCITLLVRELAHSRFGTENEFLTDKDSENYLKVRRLFRTLGVIPSWSNARDVKNLAKQMVGQFIQQGVPPERKLSAELIIACMKGMITQRKGFLSTLGVDSNTVGPGLEDPEPAPPVSPPKKTVCAPRARTADRGVDIDTAREGTDSKNQSHTNHPVTHTTTSHTQVKDPPGLDGEQQQESDDGMHFREDGVSDAVWRGLRQAQKEESARRRQLKTEEQLLQRNLRSAEAAMGSCNDQDDDYSDKMAACDAIRDQLTGIQRRLQDQERIHQTLRMMNRCVNGFCWTREAGGYRCEGGMHFVTDAEVQARMTWP